MTGMAAVRTLSDYDYGWVLLDPTELGVEVSEQPPLPPLVEPAEMPPVTAPSDEAMVRVEDRRIRVLSAYWHAGWPSAGPDAFVRTSVLDRLRRIAAGLPAEFGLAVLDAYRPLSLQRDIYDAAYADPALPPGFVSVPNTDPTLPPPHLTGGTVDVTLTWHGHALALGTQFDDFTDAARTDAFEDEPGVLRELRRLLYRAMRSEEFVVIDCEWWHFEYGTRRWAAITGNAPLYGPGDVSTLPA